MPSTRAVRKPTDPIPRLLGRCEYDQESGCLVFTGALTSSGYVRVGAYGKVPYGHRLMYEWGVGEIPEGFAVHHKCGVPSCVQPSHLECLSALDHRQEHGLGLECCPVCGGSDWRVSPSSGRRRCRTCSNKATSAYQRAAKRGEITPTRRHRAETCPSCGSDDFYIRRYSGFRECRVCAKLRRRAVPK